MYQTEAQKYNAFFSPGTPLYQIPSDLDIDNMAATLEAQSILSVLLLKLQEEGSKHEKRYGDWMKRGGPQLEEFLFRCLRREVLVYLQLGNGNVNSIKNIAGDLSSGGRAVYIHGILGLDKRSRVYIGQTNSLNKRLKQHWNFRYRRDNPSLHYHAMQHSLFDNFCVLATLPSPGSKGYQSLPGMDQPELVLNVLEMWCCLLFRTLPRQTLEFWLPEHLSKGAKLYKGSTTSMGLNIASPLDHGDNGSREWVDLMTSDDSLVLQYVKGNEEPKVEVKQEKFDEEIKPSLAEETDYSVDKNRGLPRLEFEVSINPVHLIGAAVLGLAVMRWVRGRR